MTVTIPDTMIEHLRDLEVELAKARAVEAAARDPRSAYTPTSLRVSVLLIERQKLTVAIVSHVMAQSERPTASHPPESLMLGVEMGKS